MSDVRVVMGGVLVVFLATSPVAAFPDKPITVNVCQPAGGGTDRNLQTLVPFAERHLGQSFIVQYRAGAGGTLAMQEIKAAPKDGHTLVFCDTGGSLFGPIAQNISFKPDDVIPIAQLADVPWVFTVHASTPYKTVQDVIDAAKKAPGQLKASIADIASADHYTWLLFARASVMKIKADPEFHTIYNRLGQDLSTFIAGDAYAATWKKTWADAPELLRAVMKR